MEFPKDTPAWGESLIKSARQIGMASAGRKSDDEVLADLERIFAKVEGLMVETIGGKKTTVILDGFRTAVLDHKHAIEAAESVDPVINPATPAAAS
jgi:hypothetical protein